MQSLLIKATTRAQREEIVRRALSACGSPVTAAMAAATPAAAG